MRLSFLLVCAVLALVLSGAMTIAYGQPVSLQIVDHVVINEFELNPPGEDAGNEWAELYNPTAATVNIGGWTLQTTAGETVMMTLPEGTLLGPAVHYLVTYPTQWLDNENESIILRDRNGLEVDRTPIKSDMDNDDRSWQRYPDGSDNWVYAPSTPSVTDIPEYPSPAILAVMIVAATLLMLRRKRKMGQGQRR